MSDYLLFSVVNFAFCIGIIWQCICQLNSDHARRSLLIRAKYTVLLTGSMITAWQPIIFGSYPTNADVVMSGVVFMYLVFSMLHWRHEK